MSHRKAEEIIKEQLAELIPKFKPRFGNLEHIEICKTLGKISELEKKLEEKRSAAADIKAIEKKLDNLKGQALYLLKTYL
jgi:predicted mannosyl-3-phosphoglycerate phosphatase (HAD superfamily)